MSDFKTLSELVAENSELRKDKERLDWLISERGRGWAYWRMENGEKITLEIIDAAINQPT